MQLGGPQCGVRKHLNEALDQGARVLFILRRQRQPLRDDAALLQARRRQTIEVRRVQIDRTRGRRRRRFERDQVVAFGIAQQFAPSVAHPDVHAGIGAHAVVALELRRGAHHGRQQFGDRAVFKPRPGQQSAAGNAGAESDHQRRARRLAVDDQRQQRLQAHISQRRHRVAGVGDALDIEPPELSLASVLFDDRHRAARTLFVEGQIAAARFGEQRGEPVRRRHDHGDERQRGEDGHTPARERPHVRAAQHGDQTHCAREDGKCRECVNEAQLWHEHETSQQGPGDPTGGIERNHGADAAPCVPVIHVQTQREGERRAQQQGRNEDDAHGSHREACAHRRQQTVRGAECCFAREALPVQQPVAQYGDLEQRD